MARFNAINPKDRLNQIDKMNEAELQFASMEAKNAARLVFERHQGSMRPEFTKLLASYLTDLSNEAIRARQEKAGS